MPDSSGIPLLGDLAAMRDAMVRLGGDPKRLNPSVPVDLIVDHAVMVDNYATPDAERKNLAIELQRNAERYAFLRWGSQAFDNFRIVPPAAHLPSSESRVFGEVVWESNGVAYPDSVLGMDSIRDDQQPGILGWVSAGWKSARARWAKAWRCSSGSGRLPPARQRRNRVTSTDLVSSVTQMPAQAEGGGQVLEYFGPGVANCRCPIARRSPT